MLKNNRINRIMKIIKSNKSMRLTISSREIESVVRNVVLGSGRCEITKTSQATQISEKELDYLDAWLNKLTKKIWTFNYQVNAQKNIAMEFLNKYPEYGKGILPLINSLQTSINTTVNDFVDKVNTYEPQATQAPKAGTTPYTKETKAKIGEDYMKSSEGLKYIEGIEKSFKTLKDFERYRGAVKNMIVINRDNIKYRSKLEALLRWATDKINAAIIAKKNPNDLIGGLSRGIGKEVTDATKNTPVARPVAQPVAQPVTQPVTQPRMSEAERAEKYLSNDYLNNKLGIVLAANLKK